jgi:uncharacterized membrane protein YhaH (DUF805 family)
MKKCPYCSEEEIQDQAMMCRSCGESYSIPKSILKSDFPKGLLWYLFSPKGRINRWQFWLGAILTPVVASLSMTILYAIGVNEDLVTKISVISVAIMIWIPAVQQIKRWHDRDKSGSYILVCLIPFFGWLWVAIECGLLPGTDGPNIYGDGPGSIF